MIARSWARVQRLILRLRFTQSEIYGAVLLGLLLALLVLYSWLFR